MKLTIPTPDLLAQLQTVSRVASTRSAVQALAGVMISAAEDGHAQANLHVCRTQLRVAILGG